MFIVFVLFVVVAFVCVLLYMCVFVCVCGGGYFVVCTVHSVAKCFILCFVNYKCISCSVLPVLSTQ